MKTVLITGVSSGFGKAIAETLAEKGYNVYGTVRNATNESLAYKTIIVDVCKPETIQAGINEVLQQAGKIDVLINNAGFGLTGEMELTDNEDRKRLFDTNIFGYIDMVNAVLPVMRKQKEGKIINIASLAGVFAIPYQGFYSTTKFAINGYSEALHYELIGTGIKVVVVNPGDYKTSFTANRILTPIHEEGRKVFDTVVKAIVKDETKGLDPKHCAKLIAKIIEKNNPCFRYVAGSLEHKLSAFIKRLLPDSWFFKIIESHYNM
ncbi:MAG: SDR family oxidoreductase [Bacteroidetes bacterium]|nr:SDR family oxidoreductase [Bacteroidota bacterium]